MSVCMSTSAKCFPRAQARFLASRRTSTTSQPWATHTTPKARWNSSRAGNSGGKVEAGVGKRASKGWTTFSVLSLMAATAFGAHGFAKYQAEAREARMRDYSSPEKWVEPNYASRKDMEDVSFPKTLLKKAGEPFLQSWGFLWRLGTLVPPAQSACWPRVGWLGPLALPFPSLSNRYGSPVIDGSFQLATFLGRVLTGDLGNQRNSCRNGG
jgi:hypothetical protein